MKYKLYVGENCHQCQDVINGIKDRNIEIDIMNVDLDGEKPPIDVFAYPALFKGEILLRYGSDILDYFKIVKA